MNLTRDYVFDKTPLNSPFPPKITWKRLLCAQYDKTSCRASDFEGGERVFVFYFRWDFNSTKTPVEFIDNLRSWSLLLSAVRAVFKWFWRDSSFLGLRSSVFFFVTTKHGLYPPVWNRSIPATGAPNGSVCQNICFSGNVLPAGKFGKKRFPWKESVARQFRMSEGIWCIE